MALSNLYPEAKSVVLWLKHGWHLTVAYVAGFITLMILVGWHPHAPHKSSVALGLLTFMQEGEQAASVGGPPTLNADLFDSGPGTTSLIFPIAFELLHGLDRFIDICGDGCK